MEIHQGLVLSHFIFRAVVNAISVSALLREMLFADGLVLISKKLVDLRISSANGRRFLIEHGLHINFAKVGDGQLSLHWCFVYM